MKLLAFDTCLDKTYIVLNIDGSIVDSRMVASDENSYHSAYLISQIADVFNTNKMLPEEIDAIAINVGPGSFTGIRACTTVARVMAQQLNKKAIGVSSLEIISKLNPTAKNTLVALDARKEMAYLYFENEIKGAVLLDDIDEIVRNNDYFVITDNKLLSRFSNFTQDILSYQENDKKLGEILSQIALEKLENGVDTNWAKLMPLYIQPPPVTKKV